MHTKTLTELNQGLVAKEFSSSELTRHYLDRIKQLDSHYNSFITVTEERAMAQAKLADEAIAAGSAAALTGIPLAHKDIFCTALQRHSHREFQSDRCYFPGQNQYG